MNLHIANLAEYPHFADVCAAWSFGEWGCQIEGRTLQAVIERYRGTASSKDLQAIPQTWVILSNTKPAGMISLKIEDHPDHKELSPWLASLYIHPEYRGQGLARQLIRHVEKHAYEMDIHKLYLFTHTAAKLYKGEGWTEVKRIRDTMGLRPEGDLLFVKDL